MTLFEQATREKFRFQSTQGLLSTEDLWDLSLQKLDDVAKRVNSELKATQTESFIETRSTDTTNLEAKLELVKHIIGVKLEEKENQYKTWVRAKEIEKLRSLIEQKEEDSLRNLSVDELRAQLQALQLGK